MGFRLCRFCAELSIKIQTDPHSIRLSADSRRRTHPAFIPGPTVFYILSH